MEEISLEEALVLAKEIGEALGGRQQKALELLSRHAIRGTRRSASSTAVEAFKKAGEILEEGQKDQGRGPFGPTRGQ